MSTEHIPTPSNDQTPIAIFWFRRDLRIEDNTALTAALDKDIPVLPLFIFDRHILNELAEDDARVNFIHRSIQRIKEGLKDHGSDIICLYGEPVTIWKALILKYNIAAVFTNRDYEPYAIGRDKEIAEILTNKNIPFLSFKIR